MSSTTDACTHGLDAAWCYLCRIDGSGVPARVAWGLDDPDWIDDPSQLPGPMDPDRAAYLRFLSGEYAEAFDETLTEGESVLLIESYLDERMTASQLVTLRELAAHASVAADEGLSYGQARYAIRRLVALRGLRSA
ncbi:MAG: hypothetical protein ACXVQJ_05670 [Actinomycetota bacterium]